MGTALTEPQLKELRRLTGHLYLCFDADAAGEAATVRGMELAVRLGFDVRIVPLPPGLDPADAADGFERRLGESVGYLVHRVTLEPKSQEGFDRVQRLIEAAPAGPERDEAARFAADRFGLPVRVAGATATVVGEASRKLLGAGERLERDFLAICAARPELAERYLRELDDRHFDLPLHRRLRAFLAGEIPEDEELVGLRAELDATVAEEGLDEDVARELVLRLEERLVVRELADLSGDDLARTVELQGVLARIREALQRVESELR
jgi:DNA primase